LLLTIFLGCADIPDDLRNEPNGNDNSSSGGWGNDPRSSDSGDYNSKSSSSIARDGCDGKVYAPYQFCANGFIYDFCNGTPYNPSIVACCNNYQYTMSTQFCSGITIYAKCGGYDYNPGTQFCSSDIIYYKCGTSTYYPESQFCSNIDNKVYSRCGGLEYNTETQICLSNAVRTKCGTSGYDPSTQFCNGNTVYNKCNGEEYNPLNQRCQSNVVETRCETGSNYHNPLTQFCSGSTVYTRCGGLEYEPSNQRCQNDTVETKCGTGWYNPIILQYCSNGTVKTYKSVTINWQQTWMAENLNYEIEGSKCYDNDPDNCAIYGRLYDWATAMALPSYCNSISCASQVSAKHQGICPSGWHIPSNTDWDALMTAVGGSSTAGKYLKATSGWYDCGPADSSSTYLCEDYYGFSALPGGYSDYTYGYFSSIGYSGYWWSSNEYASYYGSSSAYSRYMSYYYENANSSSNNKSNLYSVRCLRD
jgi:uncharacterized protein (TIGR02145 family)